MSYKKFKFFTKTFIIRLLSGGGGAVSSISPLGCETNVVFSTFSYLFFWRSLQMKILNVCYRKVFGNSTLHSPFQLCLYPYAPHLRRINTNTAFSLHFANVSFIFFHSFKKNLNKYWVNTQPDYKLLLHST